MPVRLRFGEEQSGLTVRVLIQGPLQVGFRGGDAILTAFVMYSPNKHWGSDRVPDTVPSSLRAWAHLALPTVPEQVTPAPPHR